MDARPNVSSFPEVQMRLTKEWLESHGFSNSEDEPHLFGMPGLWIPGSGEEPVVDLREHPTLKSFLDELVLRAFDAGLRTGAERRAEAIRVALGLQA